MPGAGDKISASPSWSLCKVQYIFQKTRTEADQKRPDSATLQKSRYDMTNQVLTPLLRVRLSRVGRGASPAYRPALPAHQRSQCTSGYEKSSFTFPGTM